MTAKYDERACVDAGQGTIFTHAPVTPIPESNAKVHLRSNSSLLTIRTPCRIESWPDGLLLGRAGGRLKLRDSASVQVTLA
jgi:hypothetical protein